MPIELSVVAAGDNRTISQYPAGPWGWSTVAQAAYSGSTSANGASTHSTMSYYVQPLMLDAHVNASRIDMVGSFNTGGNGTGSATVRHYFGLYQVSSDSLTLISSWMAGMNYSQNSVTAITMSVITGSASVSIASFGGNNSSAHITGPKLIQLAQGAASTITAGQYFGVYGMHSLSNAANPLAISLGIQANTYIAVGDLTSATSIWNPLNGAFSSTSSTNAANSNQWLMPPSVATNAVTATRSNEQLRAPVMFRGI